jgi:hypothetical protein
VVPGYPVLGTAQALYVGNVWHDVGKRIAIRRSHNVKPLSSADNVVVTANSPSCDVYGTPERQLRGKDDSTRLVQE